MVSEFIHTQGLNEILQNCGVFCRPRMLPPLLFPASTAAWVRGWTDQCKFVEAMSARLCILTLASIHTTAATVANALFDPIARPRWISVLRYEIHQTLKSHGKLGDNMPVKSWLQHLEIMDSFILESQRFSPPILCKYDLTHYECCTKARKTDDRLSDTAEDSNDAHYLKGRNTHPKRNTNCMAWFPARL
jgi:hypothetical protein